MFPNRHYISLQLPICKGDILIIGEIFYGLVSEDVNEGCLISWHFNGLVVIGDNSSQQDNLLRKEYLSQDSYGARLIQM